MLLPRLSSFFPSSNKSNQWNVRSHLLYALINLFGSKPIIPFYFYMCFVDGILFTCADFINFVYADAKNMQNRSVKYWPNYERPRSVIFLCKNVYSHPRLSTKTQTSNALSSLDKKLCERHFLLTDDKLAKYN